MSGPYGHGMTNRDIAETKQAQFEDAQRANIKPAWRARHEQLEEIVASRPKDESDPKTKFAAAIKHLDGSYKDLTSNPSTLNEFSRRLHAKAIDAAEKGGSMDWLGEGVKIGEGMRKEMGAPTSDERSRAEALAEFRRARGLSQE